MSNQYQDRPNQQGKTDKSQFKGGKQQQHQQGGKQGGKQGKDNCGC